MTHDRTHDGHADGDRSRSRARRSGSDDAPAGDAGDACCDDGCCDAGTDGTSGDISGAPSSNANADESVLRLSVPDMDCASCADKVESSVRTLDGVARVDPRPASGTLEVAYDSAGTSPDDVHDRVEAAGYDVADGETATLDVPEMDCPSCAGKVENALDGLSGISAYDTQPTAGRVEVTYDPARTGRDAVVAAVEGAGYDVIDADAGDADSGSVWTGRRALQTWAGAVLLVAGLVFEWALAGQNATLATVFGRDVTVAWALYLGATLAAGREIVRSGYYSARNRSRSTSTS